MSVIDEVIPYRQVLERLPSGVLVVDAAGRVLHANAAAHQLLGEALRREPPTCCDLFGCRRPGTPLEHACITRLAMERPGPLPEVRVDVPLRGDATGSVWLDAAAVDGTEVAVALQIRPALAGDRRRRTQPHWIGGPQLRIHTLGRTRIESGEAALPGEWLAHRPGELLKYLVCERDRIVPIEELIEIFWSDAARAGATNVRQCVHTLRDRLDPGREKRRAPAFVLGRRGGYELDPESVWIDADEFVRSAERGLHRHARGDVEQAEALLTRATDLYRGDFLADEPYADWALAERERLRDLAGQALRALSAMRLGQDDLEGALGPLQRLAQLEPFDDRAQRDLLALLLRVGRHAEARRRYEITRRRFKRAFGSEPQFMLAELAPAGLEA